MFAVPPGETGFHKLFVDVQPIREKHVTDSAPVFVEAFSFHCDVLAVREFFKNLLGLAPVVLAFLRCVNAVEPDAFGLVVVEYVEGVAVNAGNNTAWGVAMAVDERMTTMLALATTFSRASKPQLILVLKICDSIGVGIQIASAQVRHRIVIQYVKLYAYYHCVKKWLQGGK